MMKENLTEIKLNNKLKIWWHTATKYFKILFFFQNGIYLCILGKCLYLLFVHFYCHCFPFLLLNFVIMDLG